jgi:hypothetical protein
VNQLNDFIYFAGLVLLAMAIAFMLKSPVYLLLVIGIGSMGYAMVTGMATDCRQVRAQKLEDELKRIKANKEK